MLHNQTQGLVQSQRNYRRALEHAETIAGGAEALASRLRVSSSKLKAWADGLEDIPDSIYLAIVDIICEATQDELNRAREYRPSFEDGE